MNKINKEILDRFSEFFNLHKDEEPIYKGCKNQVCNCTGECKQITGWRKKTNINDITWLNV